MSDFAPSALERLIFRIQTGMDRELGGIELAKIVYLVDVEYCQFFGETFTGEEYIRAPRGPLARGFAVAVARLSGHELIVFKEPGRTQWGKNCHRPGPSPRFSPDLDPTAESIVTRVLRQVGPLSPVQVEQVAYGTEPMQAILAAEKADGPKTGQLLDMKLVTRSAAYLRWRANQDAVAEADPEYEEFIRVERMEVEPLLASLG